MGVDVLGRKRAFTAEAGGPAVAAGGPWRALSVRRASRQLGGLPCSLCEGIEVDCKEIIIKPWVIL